MNKEDIEDIVRATVKQTLFDLGMNAEDNESIEEVRRDMAHLRKWRKSVDQVQNVSFGVAVSVIITGLIGALWMGFKIMMGQ